MPQVSVIMPFHRVSPYLRPAVQSILNQTLRDLELILVDNGTGTGLTGLGELGRDPRIRLISHAANLGVAAAHIAARPLARSEFIANMDSDDVALPERLERQLAVLRAEPGLGLLSTHALAIDETGRILGPQFTLGTDGEQRVYSAYSLPVINPTLAGRRSVFEQFPMRGEFAIASDFDFFSRVAEVYPCRALPEVLLHYRLHPDQVTVAENPTMVLNACRIRVLTARRRAGRPENLAPLLGSFGEGDGRPSAQAGAYAHFSRLAQAEGFPLLAVFLARRRVAVQRSIPALAGAVRALLHGLGREPRQAAQLLRMFFTGPVRTHGLRPL